MPLIPNFLERQIFFTLNQGPAPMLDIFGAVAFRTVLAAVRLGVFDALSGGPLSAPQVASKIKVAQRGVVILLDTLIGLGYVTQNGDQYANSSMTAKWLT